MKKILALMAMLVGSPVMAGDVLFTWDVPTLRADGTTLEANEIGGYKIYAKGTSSYSLVASPAATATSFKLTGITGSKNYVMRTVDTNGIESADSNIAKVSFSPPNSPSLIKVSLTAP